MAFDVKELERYAEVLIWGLKKARNGRYRRGDIILLRFDAPAIKLLEVVYEKIMTMGMNPIVRMGLTSKMERIFYEKANRNQLTFIAPGEKELIEKANGSIYLYAPESLTHLSSVDPKKIGKAILSRKFLRDIMEKREEIGEFGWTLGLFPTPALARHADMKLDEYEKQVKKACFLDKIDSVREWNRIFHHAKKLKKWLNSLDIKGYLIESENIDLFIRHGKRRRWVGISGHNIPSFELFISPDWRGTEGTYYADQPSFKNGNLVKGVRLQFKKGSVVQMEAEEGEGFLIKQLSVDRGANRIGEFSLTDKRFSRIDRFMANTLYDENYGGDFGNCHIALGASYSDTYDGNPKDLTKEEKRRLGFNDSAIHWDLVNTEEKRVTAILNSGKELLIYEKGIFLY